MRDPKLWDFDPDIIEIDQKQIPNPELGPLERRIDLTYEDALFTEDISVEDTMYWFTEPAGAHDSLQDALLLPTVKLKPGAMLYRGLESGKETVAQGTCDSQ